MPSTSCHSRAPGSPVVGCRGGASRYTLPPTILLPANHCPLPVDTEDDKRDVGRVANPGLHLAGARHAPLVSDNTSGQRIRYPPPIDIESSMRVRAFVSHATGATVSQPHKAMASIVNPPIVFFLLTLADLAGPKNGARRAATTHRMDDSNIHHTGLSAAFSKWQERNLYIYFTTRKNK